MDIQWPTLMALGVGFFLSLEDLKTKSVPLWGALVFGGASIWEYQNWVPPLVIFSLSCFLYFYFYGLHKKKALGGIDVVLMTASGFWFPLTSVPYFLLVVGLLTLILAHFNSGDKKIPLMPGIYAGAIIAFMIG
jgi:hypothetical protein